MSKLDPIVYRELPVIQKIIADETWLEGERRGRYVSPEDPVVREKVCDVVLSIGEQLRIMVQGQCEAQVLDPEPNVQHEAA
jgi:hypothetical protein